MSSKDFELVNSNREIQFINISSIELCPGLKFLSVRMLMKSIKIFSCSLSIHCKIISIDIDLEAIIFEKIAIDIEDGFVRSFIVSLLHQDMDFRLNLTSLEISDTYFSQSVKSCLFWAAVLNH